MTLTVQVLNESIVMDLNRIYWVFQTNRSPLAVAPVNVALLRFFQLFIRHFQPEYIFFLIRN